MTFAFDIIGNALIVVGALIFASAALGVLRFPDAYTRISAVGTAGGLGMVFVVIGALALQPNILDAVKVVLIVALQLATSAIGSIAIARSASLTGAPMRRARYDELEDGT
ncbi:cation:proton antiporter [Agromyces atrinae]|uniref:Cation:proton antiporter n=1 Tax=Agromyces atrinae TaxID=592376 RepID=A0A4Q2MCP6_9MICO|nr:monovalent cation/H(+) antiporter subunit G [Agromyces atrinae]NYD67958.1 multicomponent Na+:H+ antiporter subunit G [Agromyces atrinae]RXZ87881.1 cation:proton antiporter [Agromyces atrinae]